MNRVYGIGEKVALIYTHELWDRREVALISNLKLYTGDLRQIINFDALHN